MTYYEVIIIQSDGSIIFWTPGTLLLEDYAIVYNVFK